MRLAGVRWLGERMVREVGWAENARATAWLWEWQGHWSTELTLGAMLVSVLCLTGWRRWAGMALGCAVLGLFCWPVGEGLAIQLVTYSDDSRRFEADLPQIYWTPDVLAAGFVAGLCLLGRRGWAVVLLCPPMFALAASAVGLQAADAR